MPGHKKWSGISKHDPNDPVWRERVDRHKAVMETALALGKLRQQRGMTQATVASRMGTAQPNVSRIEGAEDVYLSTLNNYVAALGGRLEVHVVFPDDDVVVYTGDDERTE